MATCNRREVEGQILWFESLRDSILDCDIESAISSIEGAIKLLERQKRELDEEELTPCKNS